MPRRSRSRRFWSGVDSHFRSVPASPIDSRSESAHGPDESRRHDPADRERRRYGSPGFLCRRSRENVGRLCCDSRPIEIANWKFRQRRDRRPGQEYFYIPWLCCLPRRGRRRRFRAVPNSYSIFASPIDSRSESAHGPDESRRHGLSASRRCRYGSPRFLRDQPRGHIARPRRTSHRNHRLETSAEKEGCLSSPFHPGRRPCFLIFAFVTS